MSNVKHHEEAVIAEVSTQLSEVVGVIERHLEPTLLAVHCVRLRSGWRPEATRVILIAGYGDRKA